MTKVVLTYKIGHNWNVEELLKGSQKLLQQAISDIWDNIIWKEKKAKHHYSLGNGKYNYYETTRLIPHLPKSNEFKRELRNKHLKDWHFAKHYVDSAIKTAYSILESWRQNYLKGLRRKRKPTVKTLRVLFCRFLDKVC